MILNTGARTDIPQYYAKWLLNRFAEGYVLVRNPLFPHKVTRYVLNPERIDLVMFCSKNYAPLLAGLPSITERYPTYFHYTITAYGRDIEPGVPSIEESVETLLRLERIVGARRIAWRYDPVLVTPTYSVERHLETFEHLAGRLAGHVDRCIFSFVERYKKLETNMPELQEVSDADKERLARGIGEIARRHGLWVQTCATKESWSHYGIHRSGCTTLDILGQANHLAFRKLKHPGLREGCGCYPSRDIGAYETCPNGCRYCYANKSHAAAARNYAAHDPASPLLIGTIGPDDEITDADQRSLLATSSGQLSLGI